jgi:thioredoxin reductase
LDCGSSWVPGLATSVYAASEGLSVLVLDCRSSGGQAGASARIENYLGVPTGISGMALMARAYNQAHKFGVETTIPSEVVGFDTPDANKPGRFVLRLASGDYFEFDKARENFWAFRLAIHPQLIVGDWPRDVSSIVRPRSCARH